MEGGRNLPLFPFRDGNQNLIKTITQICMCVCVCVIAFFFPAHSKCVFGFQTTAYMSICMTLHARIPVRMSRECARAPCERRYLTLSQSVSQLARAANHSGVHFQQEMN